MKYLTHSTACSGHCHSSGMKPFVMSIQRISYKHTRNYWPSKNWEICDLVLWHRRGKGALCGLEYRAELETAGWSLPCCLGRGCETLSSGHNDTGYSLRMFEDVPFCTCVHAFCTRVRHFEIMLFFPPYSVFWLNVLLFELQPLFFCCYCFSGGHCYQKLTDMENKLFCNYIYCNKGCLSKPSSFLPVMRFRYYKST